MGGLFKWLNERKIFSDLNEEEFSWVLYDVGNSAYTMLATALIPIWFKNIAIGTDAGRISSQNATAYWALAGSIVTAIIAIIGPIIGAVADHKDRRKILFNTVIAVGVAGCVLNGLINSWLPFLIIFALTKIFYSSANTIYDSMLNDVTTDERADQVSSYGYAWGYIGSCIPFLVALIAYVCGPDMFGILSESVSRIIGFTVTAAWWWFVTMPLLKNYKQKNYVEGKNASVSAVFRKIFGSFAKIIKKDKKVLFFLLAYFLYIDGVHTIINQSTNIGTELGLDKVGLVILLLGTQVVAWIGSLVFAKLSKKYDTAKLILICIFGYFCVALYALTLKSLLHFGILAFGVGCFQGSIQSLSRSYYAKIIPAENSGEYFGIYDIFSKGSAFIGEQVIAWVMLANGTINIAVASLAVFFALGFLLLIFADKQKNMN